MKNAVAPYIGTTALFTFHFSLLVFHFSLRRHGLRVFGGRRCRWRRAARRLPPDGHGQFRRPIADLCLAFQIDGLEGRGNRQHAFREFVFIKILLGIGVHELHESRTKSLYPRVETPYSRIGSSYSRVETPYSRTGAIVSPWE